MNRGQYGKLTEVRAELIPDTKSGTPGATAIKMRGVITWVAAAADALKTEVRLYDRLFEAMAMTSFSSKGMGITPRRDLLTALSPRA